jgi:hypothetical protein
MWDGNLNLKLHWSSLRMKQTVTISFKTSWLLEYTIGYMDFLFQQTSINRTDRSWLIVSLRLDGNNFFWGVSLWNGWSIKLSIFESTRYHSPITIMVWYGWALWSSGSGIIAIRCGSPGIKTNMDTILKRKKPLYWHRYNKEWQSCTNSRIGVFQVIVSTGLAGVDW